MDSPNRKRNLLEIVDDISTSKLLKLDTESINIKNDNNEESDKTKNCNDIDICDTPYYKITKEDNGSVTFNISYGYTMARINNSTGLYENIISRIPKGPSSFIPGCYKFPSDNISLDFLLDSNKYFEVSDTKVVHLSHGDEIINLNIYDKDSLGFTVIICLQNTGRSIIMLNHTINQHIMQTNYCLIIRSFYTFSILPQIMGESTYLIVRLSTTDKFNITWEDILKAHKEKDNIAYIDNSIDDHYLSNVRTRERKIYNAVEALVFNRILLEELGARLTVIKQLNNNIETMLHYNNNMLLSDMVKKSTEPIIKDIENMEITSYNFIEDIKKAYKSRNKIRDKLLKSALSSDDINEILSSIPSYNESRFEQFSINQHTIYKHYKKVLEANTKNMDIGYYNLENNYIFSLYKLYGQNDLMITHILSFINRVKIVIENIKRTLDILDENNIKKVEKIITDRIEKNQHHTDNNILKKDT